MFFFPTKCMRNLHTIFNQKKRCFFKENDIISKQIQRSGKITVFNKLCWKRFAGLFLSKKKIHWTNTAAVMRFESYPCFSSITNWRMPRQRQQVHNPTLTDWSGNSHNCLWRQNLKIPKFPGSVVPWKSNESKIKFHYFEWNFNGFLIVCSIFELRNGKKSHKRTLKDMIFVGNFPRNLNL